MLEPLRDQLAFWTPNYGEMEPARWLRISARCRSAARVCAWVATEGDRAPEPPGLAWRGERTVLDLPEGPMELAV